ncbi:MAG: IS200/IS605 family transposase [Verrucomicrobiota bacterium]
MSQSLSRIYLHIVFSTKDRQPFLLDSELRKSLHAYIAGTMKQLDCIPVEIGGVEDHIHILCLLPRARTVADVVKETKRLSTRWLQEQDLTVKDFHWQSGYGVFSVSQSSVNAVTEYITNQEEHHRKVSFQDEYRAFLKKHAVDFDEKYVWD